MRPDNDSIVHLFDAGEYGRIHESVLRREPDRHADPLINSLVAQAVFEAGDATRARQWAVLCVESNRLAAKARGQLVLALCARATGNTVEAKTLHQAALRAAEEAGDEDLEAWAAIQLLRHVFLTADSSAAAMVPTTRARVSKAGSVHATAFLHATVAVAEGQLGRTEEARRHLQIADRLVTRKPHPWLQCSILGTMAAIAMTERKFNVGFEQLQRLRTIAAAHRLNADFARSSVHCGNFEMLVGRYDEAEVAFQEAIHSPHSSRIAKIAAAESMARIRLAQGRLDDCGELLDNIDRIAREASLTKAFGVQWAKVTRARLCLKRGEGRAAFEHLALLGPLGGEGLDQPVVAAARMTAAHALIMSGDSVDGARYLAAGFSMDPSTLPELQGQFYYSAASALLPSNRGLAGVLRERARRLWTSEGTASLELEFPAPDDPGHSDGHDSRQHFRDALVVESIASLLALGTNPSILAHEMQETIRRLGCSPKVGVYSTSEQTLIEQGQVELQIPEKNSKSLTVRCAAPASPEQAVMLGSVIRIGQTAIELERLREAERHRAALWPESSAEASADAIFEGNAMRDVITIARRIANTTVPVLITGETGTGKEVLARLIHAYSERSKAVFIPFNCTSVSRDLMEAQLFGHRKGAFTGATESSQGVVRAANRGTLLLDEIGDMHLDVQPKLLRFLESAEIHPVGEPKPLGVDVRVIAATNADLKGQVATGGFREDLYYRLSIVPLHLPPLRERRGEIAALASHYLAKHAREFGKEELTLSDEAVEYLLLFRWPGNIRQLANEMRRLAVMAESGTIVTGEHLSTDISGFSTSRQTEVCRREARDDELVVRLDQPLGTAVEQVERAMIINALGRAEGAVERAAEMLGLSRKGLYLKRQRYEIGSTAERLEDKSVN